MISSSPSPLNSDIINRSTCGCGPSYTLTNHLAPLPTDTNGEGEDEAQDFRIRQAKSEDITKICEWRTRELQFTSHPEFFQKLFKVYPSGWLVVEDNRGDVIGSIFAMNFNDQLSYGALYAVRPAYRCKGIGKTLWNHRLKYIGERNLAINSADTRLEANKKNGMALSFKMTGYVGIISAPLLEKAKLETEHIEKLDPGFQIIDLASQSPNYNERLVQELKSYDTSIHIVPRTAFIEELLRSPDIVTLVALESSPPAPPASSSNQNGAGNNVPRIPKVLGYGMLRPLCHQFIIGPIFADDPKVVRALFLKLTASLPGPDKTLYFMAIDENGLKAFEDEKRKEFVEKIVKDLEMRVEFNLYRMYRFQEPTLNIPYQKVYVLTSIELFLV